MLDRIKREIAVEVARRFPLDHIRGKSLANLARWQAAGVWSRAYDEWKRILQSRDDGELLKAMLGRDELVAKGHPERAELLNAIGQDSEFHASCGYYADPVDMTTAVLPEGWQGRFPSTSQGVRRT